LKTIIITLIVSLAITCGAFSQSTTETMLVRVYFADVSNKNAIANEGIDIWEAGENYVLAMVSSEELKRLENKDYFIEPVDISKDALKEDFNIDKSRDLPLAVYRDYSTVVNALFALEASGVARVYDIGTTIEGRDIWAVKISDNVDSEENEPEIFFCGDHHAREWISVEVPLMLAEYLTNQYLTNPNVKSIVDNGEIWICPVVNPDGYSYTWNTYRLWRKNRRHNADNSYGVDLNRNYSYMWGGTGSSGTPSNDIYRGTAPFSEPETQVVRDFINVRDFSAILSYHSYSQLILFPWGYTSSQCPHFGLFSMMTQEMADLIYGVHGFTYTAQQSAALYLTSGDTTDWAYGELGLPAFTIELRPNSYPPGFELPATQITPTFEENLPAAFFLLEWTQEIVDQDFDSLPDCWEYFKLGGISYLATNDNDDDKKTNYEEYIAGTDPLDPDSFFTVTNISSKGNVTIEWKSINGKFYSVYYCDDEVSSLMSWHLAVSGVPAASSSTTQWIDDGTQTGIHPSDPSVNRRHYKIGVSK
jgi:carboxypeptidase T